MKRLTRTAFLENDLTSIIGAFFLSFNIGALLKKIGAYKTKGIPALAIFEQLFTLVFTHKSLFQALRTDGTDNIASDIQKREPILSKNCNIHAYAIVTNFLYLPRAFQWG